MAYVGEVRERLNELKTKDRSSAEDRKAICDDLQQLCDEVEASDPKFDVFCSLILHGDASLVRFLAQASNDEESTIVTGLQTLAVVVSKSKNDVLLRDLDSLITLCLRHLANYLKFKKVHEQTSLLVIEIFDRLHGPSNEQALYVEKFLSICKRLADVRRLEPAQKRTLFNLLGVLCEYYPGSVNSHLNVPKIAKMLRGELDSNTSNRFNKPEYTVCECCIYAIDKFLDNFNTAFEQLQGGMDGLYENLVQWAEGENVSRFGPSKSAVKLFTRHAELFSGRMYSEYRKLYNAFQFWALKTEREWRGIGLNAIEALLQQVSKRLASDRDVENAKLVYGFFVQQRFRKELRESIRTREIAMAVKGYGLFGEACKRFASEKETLEMLKEVAEKAEVVFFCSQDPVENRITYAPQFLESFSRLCMAVDKVPLEYWIPMENLMLLYLQHFPMLETKYHFITGLTTYRLLLASLPHEPALIHRLMRSLLVRISSCAPEFLSQQVETEEEQKTEKIDPKTIVCNDYLPLWHLLLKDAPFRTALQQIDANFGADTGQQLAKNIYGATVGSVLGIIERLDLNLVQKQEEARTPDETPDPANKYEAQKLNDFWVFVNVVDFLIALLPTTEANYFIDWIAPTSSSLIEMSIKHPLLSGFYKLLSCCLDAAHRVNYFETCDQFADRHKCFELYCSFADQVFCKLNNCKDELLVGVLKFLLRLPSKLLLQRIDQFAQATKLALKIGLSYLSLANECIFSLERWAKEIEPQHLEPFYRQVLPAFDPYLRTEKIEQESDSKPLLSNPVKAKKSKGSKSKNLKLLEKQKEESEEHIELGTVRWRMALFLGNIGGKMNKYLVASSDKEFADNSIVWDEREHLHFAIPFQDIKPTIVLDRFLPRVCELATESGNRKTKVVACEFLHSLVVFMLGKHAHKTGAEQHREPLDKIYGKIFPVLLRLCCDADEVPRQLFQSLMSQIIHWFTSNQTYENRETAVLLDSMLESLVESPDASVRMYSAICLDEFLRWSIKQQKQTYNAKSLFKRLYIYALHPSKQNRLGAALTFNALYRTFREEEQLVNVFAIELLTIYLRSLALAHRDEESYGTLEECSSVVDHLKRIITQNQNYVARLSTSDPNRRVPIGFPEATLEHCLHYLMDQIGRPETCLRQKCWELIEELVPSLKGKQSLQTLLQNRIKSDGVQYFIHKFEGFGIGQQPRPISAALPDLISWLDGLQSALDGYFMVLSKKYLTLEQLFPSSETKLFVAIKCFLDTLSERSACGDLTSTDSSRLKTSQCTVVVRLLSLVCQMLSLGYNDQKLNKLIPNDFWSDNLWSLVVRCALDPSELGFDLSKEDTVVRLPPLVRRTLDCLRQNLPTAASKRFLQWLKNFLKDECPFPDVSELSKTDPAVTERLSACLNRVRGYELLQSARLADQLPVAADIGAQIWGQVVTSCFLPQTHTTSLPCSSLWSPIKSKFAHAALEFGLAAGLAKTVIVGDLLDQSAVNVLSTGSSRHQTTKGKVLCDRLLECLLSDVARHPKQYIELMLVKSNSAEELVATVEVVVTILDLLVRETPLRHRFGKSFNDAIVSQWPTLQNCMLQNIDSKLVLVRLLCKMAVINSEFAVIKAFLDERTNETVYQVPDKFESIFSVFCQLLTDRQLDVPAKNKVLHLLGVFALIPDADQTRIYHERLSQSVDQFVLDSLPLKSTEFAEDTPKRAHYNVSMRKLMHALSLSDSPMLLQQLVGILCRESNHVLQDEISYWLSRYGKRLPVGRCQDQLKVPLRIFLGQSTLVASEELRLNTLENVLLPMLSALGSEQLSVFFMEHVAQLLTIISAPVNQSELRADLTKRIGSYKLLQLMYNNVHVSKLKGALNDRCKQSPQDTVMLQKKICGFAREARKEGANDFGRSDSDLKLRHRCTAHNCLLAVVSNTQEATSFEKFFDSLLFGSGKQPAVWPLIVDRERQYYFAHELESYPQRKRQLLALRRSWQEATAGENHNLMNPLTQGSSTLQFLSSQVLAGSSLGSESSNFDFTLDTDGDSATEIATTKQGRTRDVEETVEETEIELEMDALNQHECMQPIVTLFNTMAQKGYVPNDKDRPPGWMTEMLREMEGPTDLNVKMYMARIVTLCEEVFRPFAKRWLRPLIDLILNTSFGPAGMHYFRVDLVVLLLGWNQLPEPDDASRLLNFLVENAAHENTQLMARNVRLIELVCKLWKTQLSFSSEYLSSQLIIYHKTKQTDSKLVTILTLCALLLKYNMSPIGKDAQMAQLQETFFNKLLPYFLKSNSAKVYRPCAEAIGFAYSYLDAAELLTPQYTNLRKVLSELFKGDSQKKGRFVLCLYGIHRHYPKILTNFATELMSAQDSGHGEFKTKCLEMCSSLATQKDYQTELLKRLSRDLEELLPSSKNNHQTFWSAKIIEKLITEMTTDQVLHWLPFITAFTEHKSAACRLVMIDICTYLYDAFHGDAISDDCLQIVQQCSTALLSSLTDADPALRQKVHNFWSHERRLHEATCERFSALLSDMYEPGCATQYLSYCTYLLLERCSKSPDFHRPIFDSPLTRCQFENLSVLTSWRRRNLTLQAPLFAATQTMQNLAPTQIVSQTFDAQLRATQIQMQKFTQTQLGGREHYDWLSGNTFDDTFVGNTMLDASGTMSDEVGSTSLLFERHAQINKQRKVLRRPHAGFGAKMTPRQPNAAAQMQQTGIDQESVEELSRLKRRILKDREQTSYFFARMTGRRKRMREMREKERRQARDQQIQLYRSYRKGDFPDVQVSHQALIAPMQTVAQQDATVAGILFESLLTGIFECQSASDKTDLAKKMQEDMNQILEQSSNNIPAPLLSAILTFARRHAKLVRLDSARVTEAALSCFMQPAAIILIEKYLLLSEDCVEPTAKRRRTARGEGRNAEISELWSSLARLYKSLGDFDNVRTIFSDKLSSLKCTNMGFEAEAAAQYEQAIDYYVKALRELDSEGEGRVDEENLVIESRLKCLDSLARWSDISIIVEKQMGVEQPSDLDSVWDNDDDSQYLQYILRSKVKLLIESVSDESSRVQPCVSGQQFASIVEKWLADAEKRQYLQIYHSQELAVCSLFKNLVDQAKNHAEAAINSVLNLWPHLSPSLTAGRREHLSRLQCSAELYEFLTFIASHKNLTDLDAFFEICKRWHLNTPDAALNGLGVWDDIVVNRIWFAEQFLNKTETVDGERSLVALDVGNQIEYIGTAVDRRNFELANKIMRECKRSVLFLNDPESVGRYARTGAWAQQEWARNCTIVSESVEHLVESLKILEDQKDSAALCGVSFSHLFSLSVDHDLTCSLSDLSADNQLFLGKLLAVKKAEKSLLTKRIFELADDKFSSAIAKSEPDADVMLGYADFIDGVLRLADDESLPSQLKTQQYPQSLTKLLLALMKSGSSEARNRFPRLLSMLELYPDVADTFETESKAVPSWMFLGWLNQIVSVLHRPYARALHQVVSDIVHKYPQAIAYPLGLSVQGYKFGTSSIDRKNQAFVDEIQDRLSRLTLVNTFVRALELLDKPGAALKNSTLQLYEKLREWCDKSFFLNERGELAEHPGKPGRSWQRFREICYAKFKELFGLWGRKMADMPTADVNSGWKQMEQTQAEVEAKDKTSSGQIVRDYSIWLDEFSANQQLRYDLELPGQYTGRCKPQPEYHTRIMGFESRITVLGSLRQPKVLRIQCNDGRNREYMVKAGEDLRQDQRIEQIFEQINTLLANDAHCKNRELSLRTYAVVPLTPNLGLIEFMSNVRELLHCLDPDGRREGPGLVWARFYQGRCLEGNSTEWKQNPSQLCSKMFHHYNGRHAAESFRLAQQNIRSDLLRSFLASLSRDLQSFFTLRSNFVLSHALICAAHYLLGIGDRHLRNFMLDVRTGRMVGIDFGYAFGVTVEMLPVPELVPFRLSKQIQTVMAPVGLDGQFSATMVHCWRVLRSNKELLLNTLDLFVKEPSLDWQRLARGQMPTLPGPQHVQPDYSLYSNQKIATVKRKLNGDNPVLIMREELARGRRKHKNFPLDKVDALICAKDNFVATAQDLERPRGYEAKALTCEQQVKCLIEMATDPITLSRIYCGWEPWY